MSEATQLRSRISRVISAFGGERPLGNDASLDRALLWLALSGAAILLQRATERDQKPPPAIWHETPIQKHND